MMVNVEVTEDDLLRGLRDDCTLCPVAHALGRLLVGKPFVYFGHVIVYKLHPTQGLPGEYLGEFPLSSEMEAFIRSFDGEGVIDVRPVARTFPLDIPQELLAS